MEHSILKLEASAGSGKTYRLALEYIGRLLQMFAALAKKPENFKGRQKALGSILAITFTVKAAQEMKVRIIKNLKSFALSTPGRQMSAAEHEFLEELAQATGLDENKIKALTSLYCFVFAIFSVSFHFGEQQPAFFYFHPWLFLLLLASMIFLILILFLLSW